MPAGQPFTNWCQQLAALSQPTRADLHIHTTHSDGVFTPAEVVRRARLAGMRAIAVTDHDTLSAFEELVSAARATFQPPPKHNRPIYPLEIISGVEITTEFHGREVHLLAYFIDGQNVPLRTALQALQTDRRARMIAIVDHVRRAGKRIPDEILAGWLELSATSLGRRHVAAYLAQSGQIGTINEAFFHLLHERHTPPKQRLPIADAIRLVRAAGGVTSWAHPPDHLPREQVMELREQGLHALEAEYPWPSRTRRQAVRKLSNECGLLISGGSDCHGPTPVHRAVGACGITMNELNALRSAATAYNSEISAM